MPVSTTFNVIYLGQLPIIDPIEGAGGVGNATAETAASILGSYNDLTTASVQSFSPISYNSPDTNGFTNTYNQDNSLATDTFNITDANSVVTPHSFDAVAQYNGTVTYADGSSVTSTIIIIQDTMGNTWVAPPGGDNAYAAVLRAQPIQGISLDSVDIFEDIRGFNAINEVINIQTVPCFAAGTMIETASGMRAVESIKVGDLVRTVDHGLQPVRWRGQRLLSAVELDANPALRPIRIRTGALGNGLPKCDLIVSPQHRVLVRSRIAQRLFDSDEVLVAAKQLLTVDGIDIAEKDDVTYVHLMFDQHEVLYSNGAETESLYAGPQALDAIDAAGIEEIFALFPELREGEIPSPARPLASGRKGRKLAMRHIQNGKPLLM